MKYLKQNKYTNDNLLEFQKREYDERDDYNTHFYLRDALYFNDCIDILENNNLIYKIIDNNASIPLSFEIKHNNQIYIYHGSTGRWTTNNKKWYYSRGLEDFIKKYVLKKEKDV